jgi:Ca2+-binding RTX toxin-like protein
MSFLCAAGSILGIKPMAWQVPVTSNTNGAQLMATDSLFVPNGVVLTTTGFMPVRGWGTGIGQEVQVFGSVISVAYPAIYLGFGTSDANTRYKITVGATGHVQGLGTNAPAIVLWGGDWQLDNAGLIASSGNAIYELATNASSTSTITNTGTIHGSVNGIFRDPGTAQTLVLNNSGLLQGDGVAYMADAANAADHVTNTGRILGDLNLGGGSDVYDGSAGRLTGKIYAGSGADTITGGIDNDWIEGGAGVDVLRGNAGNDRLDGGTGADRMIGGIGSDTYVVDDAGDIVDETGGGGIDSVIASISFNLSNTARVIGVVENLTLANVAGAQNGTGNALANVITGNDLNNVLSGLAGNDRLSGGLGNDRLSGGLGNDTLTGGAGNDIFIFNTTLGSSNRDTITDFSNVAGNNDTIWLENAVFTKLTATGGLNAASFRVGAAAADANDYIVYNKATGALYYDADGNGAGAAVHFATLAHKPTLTHADFVVI